jgi:hypothetical protein
VRPPHPPRNPVPRADRVARYHTRGVAVRSHVRIHHRNVFRAGWWAGHRHGRWGFYRRPWNYWWRPAAWGAVTGWFVWNWPQPIYYDYGGNVYFEDNSVYINGESAGSTQWYVESVNNLANSVPEDVDAEAIEWMPLGVFAIVQGEDDEAVMFLQLAVSKDGIIGGTYTNTAANSSYEIQGMVDGKNQRAAWTIGDKTSTVFETGIYNLTQDETSVLIHFGEEKTEQWLLVRMEEPEEDEAAPES